MIFIVLSFQLFIFPNYIIMTYTSNTVLLWCLFGFGTLTAQVETQALEQAKGQLNQVTNLPTQAVEQAKGQLKQVTNLPTQAVEQAKGQLNQVTNLPTQAVEQAKGQLKQVTNLPTQLNAESLENTIKNQQLVKLPTQVEQVQRLAADIKNHNPSNLLTLLGLDKLRDFLVPKLQVGAGAVLPNLNDAVKKGESLYKDAGLNTALGLEFGNKLLGMKANIGMTKIDVNQENLTNFISSNNINKFVSNPFEQFNINLGPSLNIKLGGIAIVASSMPGIVSSSVSSVQTAATNTQDDLYKLNADTKTAFNLLNNLTVKLPVSDRVSLFATGSMSNNFASKTEAQPGEFKQSFIDNSAINSSFAIGGGVSVNLQSCNKKPMKEGIDEFHLIYHKLQEADYNLIIDVPTNVRFYIEEPFSSLNSSTVQITPLDGLSPPKTYPFPEVVQAVQHNRFLLSLANLDITKGSYLIKFVIDGLSRYIRVNVIDKVER